MQGKNEALWGKKCSVCFFKMGNGNQSPVENIRETRKKIVKPTIQQASGRVYLGVQLVNDPPAGQNL